MESLASRGEGGPTLSQSQCWGVTSLSQDIPSSLERQHRKFSFLEKGKLPGTVLQNKRL